MTQWSHRKLRKNTEMEMNDFGRVCGRWRKTKQYDQKGVLRRIKYERCDHHKIAKLEDTENEDIGRNGAELKDEDIGFELISYIEEATENGGK